MEAWRGAAVEELLAIVVIFRVPVVLKRDVITVAAKVIWTICLLSKEVHHQFDAHARIKLLSFQHIASVCTISGSSAKEIYISNMSRGLNSEHWN